MRRVLVCALPTQVGFDVFARLVWREVRRHRVAGASGLLGAGGTIWLRARRYLIVLATLAPPSP